MADLDPQEPTSPFDLDQEELEELQVPSPGPSPLQKLLGYEPDSEVRAEQQRLELVASEERIQDCMVAAGFEYTLYRSTLPVPAEDEPFSSEYVINATLGYDITTRIGREPILIRENPPNPNSTYVDSLDGPAQEAYSKEYEQCSSADPEVQRRVEGLRDDATAQLSAEVSAIVEESNQRVAADQRALDAWGTWSACMGDDGYNYPHRDAIYEDFTREADALIAQYGPELLSGDILAESLDPETQSKLTELQERERATALSDLTCRQALDPILTEVRYEIEEEIVNREGDRISALLAEVEG